MKSLKEFISESKKEKVSSNTFTFNFEGIEGGEDIVKSLSELENSAVSVSDNTVTINVNADNASKLDNVIDVLQQITDIRSSSKNASDETYAQKTKSLADSLNNLTDFIDGLENGGDDDNKSDDSDDNKKKDDEE